MIKRFIEVTKAESDLIDIQAAAYIIKGYPQEQANILAMADTLGHETVTRALTIPLAFEIVESTSLPREIRDELI